MQYTKDSYIFDTGLVTKVTRKVSLVDQELLILPEHLSSLPVFRGVDVVQSLDFCVVFYWSFFLCLISSINGFWLPIWYLQFFL